MTLSLLKRAGVLLGSFVSTLGFARGQELAKDAERLREAMREPVRKLDESQTWARIDRVARGPLDTSKLTCKTDSASPFPELDKAKAALTKEYPDLVWEAIRAIADEVAKHDLAITLGTDCQDYVFETYLKALEGAAFAGLSCKGKTGIDLTQCLQDVTCEKAGRYSQFCGAKFSWER